MTRRRNGRRASTERVHSITSTQGPLGQDIDRRARRYLLQMVVRTVCFVAAVATWGRAPMWLSVGLLVGAVVLPYIAVVLANAGRERPDRADSLLDLREIAGAPLEPPAVPTPGAPTPRPYAPNPGPPGAGPVRPPADPVRAPRGPVRPPGAGAGRS